MKIIETRHQSNNLNEKYEVRRNNSGNFIKDGKYEKWYENGLKECEGEYMEEKKFGYWIFWYENGNKKFEGEYMEDKKLGRWKYWYESGELKEECEYLDDIKNNEGKLYPLEKAEISEDNNQNHRERDKGDIDNTQSTIPKEELNFSEILSEADPSLLKGLKETEDFKSIPTKETLRKVKNYSQPSKVNPLIIVGIFSVIIAVLIIIIVAQSDKNDNLSSKDKSESNTSSTQINQKVQIKQNDESTFKPNLFTPDGVVIKFIESLGKGDFSAAFGLLTEKRRGSYSLFSSTKGYGGITSTKIFSCSYNGQTNNKYEVYVDYESIDPANKSGRFKQYYYLIPFNDSFLIADVKNINISWY